METEIKLLIQDGYTHFVTYYGSEFNHSIIKILKREKEILQGNVNIELVVIIYNKARASKYDKSQYDIYIDLCDKRTIISNTYDPCSIAKAGEYLAKKCGFLLCFDRILSTDYSNHAKIIEVFKINNRPMKIINPRLVLTEWKDFAKRYTDRKY